MMFCCYYEIARKKREREKIGVGKKVAKRWKKKRKRNYMKLKELKEKKGLSKNIFGISSSLTKGLFKKLSVKERSR
jgi:hypothetical protein